VTKAMRFIRIIFILIFLIMALLSCAPFVLPEKELSVSFLDVGQGDSFYIVSPTGREVLIDGGKDGKVLTKIRELKPFWDTRFDIIIATHADLDHIGGLFSVFNRYSADIILLSQGKSKTSFDESLAMFVEKQKKEDSAEVFLAEEGMEFDLGGGARLMILSPRKTLSSDDTNDYSAIALLTYKDSSFLFMGDAPHSIEREIIQKYSLENITVLKAGHHGSRTSTGAAFLSEIKPRYVVISSGKENTYGHPHAEVLSLLENFKTKVLRTDEEGTITFTVSEDGRVTALK